MSYFRSKTTNCLLLTSVILFCTSTVYATQPLTAEFCDVNDDNVVDILDLSFVSARFGLRAGEPGYLEGLDLIPDGEIKIDDILAVFQCYLQVASTEGTTVDGVVYDGIGNQLEGVTISVLSDGDPIEVVSDPLGNYCLDNPEIGLGASEISFVGAGANDPTPGGSGEYPTIPHKPIFINGGCKNVFRNVSLPERDLTGSVNLFDIDAMVDGNSFTLNEEVTYENGGVKMTLPAGSTVNFPDGEPPVLSITRVDPARLPIQMPPGLASTIFVTFQPGGTTVDCAGDLCVEFENADLFVNGDPQPFLAGVVNGVFEHLAFVTVLNADGTEADTGIVGPRMAAKIPCPFEFAWYHVDVPLDPCPRTTVKGRVKDVDGNGVPDATVTIDGATPVITEADGTFCIPNVAAGPNGPRCLTAPFNLRATASKNGLTAVSKCVPADTGNTENETNIGDICLGAQGTVDGQVLKLICAGNNPLTGEQKNSVATPLVGVEVQLLQGGSLFRSTSTDANGNFSFEDVPNEVYSLQIPSSEEPDCFGNRSFNVEITSQGDVESRAFRLIASGTVKVTVLDIDGNPRSGVPIILDSFPPDEFAGIGGQVFEEFFDFFQEQSTVDGCATFESVPLGLFTVSEGFDGGGFDGEAIGEFGGAATVAFLSQEDQLLEVTLQPALIEECDIQALSVNPAELDLDGDPMTMDDRIDLVEICFKFPKPFDPFLENTGPFDIRMCIDYRPGGTDLCAVDDFFELPDGPTGLGGVNAEVDAELFCFFDPFLGFPFCSLARFNTDGTFRDEFVDEVFAAGFDPARPDCITILIPLDLFDGATSANIAGIVSCFPFDDFGGEGPAATLTVGSIGGGGFVPTCDVVPNGGNVPVDLDLPNDDIPDPTGDIFNCVPLFPDDFPGLE